MYDVIIIGKGPAGIQASLYTKRANLNTLVIGSKFSALEKADKIENYYGFSEPISGKQLLENGIRQAERLGVEVLEEEVIGIDYKTNSFKVNTVTKEYDTKTVIIATGINRKKPLIKGIKEFEGRGISYCAICDAFFYRKKDVAVLGSGAYAISEVEELLPVVNSVTILTNGKEEVLSRNENVKCNTREILEFVGNDRIERVKFKDNSELNINGVFIAEGTASSVDLAKKIGATTDNNKIIVDENMRTNIPGLFAAGDCTGEIYQISKAVSDGAKAGLGVVNYWKSLK